MKMVLYILGYIFIGAIVASAWEKTELLLLKNGYSIKPWTLIKYYPDQSWYTDWTLVILMIISWPFFLLGAFIGGFYLLIRKIFGL